MNNEGGNSKDQKEQFFFETLIYLITKVIKDLFTREEFIPIEEGTFKLIQKSTDSSEPIDSTSSREDTKKTPSWSSSLPSKTQLTNKNSPFKR